jgi:DNA-binding LytR/AlgR family response regulator
MTLLGWPSYSNPERPRWGNAEPALSDHVPRPTTEEESMLIDSAMATGKAIGAVPGKYMNRITVRAGDKIVLIPMCDVFWIQSNGNLLRLHLQNASYEHRMTVKGICGRLDPERFLRVHRSVIVNLDHVVEFELPRSGNAFVHLRNGKALPISGAARQTVKRVLLSQSYASPGPADLSY